MGQIRITLLILLAAVMPLAWGWAVYQVMSRLWHQKQAHPFKRRPDPDMPPPLDYQI